MVLISTSAGYLVNAPLTLFPTRNPQALLLPDVAVDCIDNFVLAKLVVFIRAVSAVNVVTIPVGALNVVIFPVVA